MGDLFSFLRPKEVPALPDTGPFRRVEPITKWGEKDNYKVVWKAEVDHRFLVEVQRTGDTGYQAELCIFDHNMNDLLIFHKLVGLSYGARFGPDFQDIEDWKEAVVSFIDNDYQTPSS